jgi:hypothetical protein
LGKCGKNRRERVIPHPTSVNQLLSRLRAALQRVEVFMEINAVKTVKVNAKTLNIHCKVRDEFEADLLDAEGAKLKEYEGYVPSFMPGQHYGDYLMLEIDIDSGQILNWKPPTAQQIEEFLGATE